MPDYFRHLALRSLQPQAVVQPRLAGRYEPLSPGGAFGILGQEMEHLASEEVQVEVQPKRSTRRVKPAPAQVEGAHQAHPDRTREAQHAEPALRARAPRTPLLAPESQLGSARVESALTPATAPRRLDELTSSESDAEGERQSAPPQRAPQPPAMPGPLELQALPEAPRLVSGQAPTPQQETRSAPPRLELKPALAPALLPHQPDPGGETQLPAPVEPAPVVNITIGRIEVRAASASKPGSPARTARAAPQVMSLEEYLKKRNGGGG